MIAICFSSNVRQVPLLDKYICGVKPCQKQSEDVRAEMQLGNITSYRGERGEFSVSIISITVEEAFALVVVISQASAPQLGKGRVLSFYILCLQRLLCCGWRGWEC